MSTTHDIVHPDSTINGSSLRMEKYESGIAEVTTRPVSRVSVGLSASPSPPPSPSASASASASASVTSEMDSNQLYCILGKLRQRYSWMRAILSQVEEGSLEGRQVSCPAD